MPARQTGQSRTAALPSEGLGVDFRGGPVVDPTENVKALTEAANLRQDDLRQLNNSRIDAEIRVLAARMEGLRLVEEVRAEYSREIRLLESDRLDKIRQVDVLAGNTAADRALVAIQTLATSQAAAAETLRSMVTTTASTIATQTQQAMAQVTERLSALEKSSYEGAGKQAVADPMMAELVSEFKASRREQTTLAGQQQGIDKTWAIVIAALMLLIAVIGIAVTIVLSR